MGIIFVGSFFVRSIWPLCLFSFTAASESEVREEKESGEKKTPIWAHPTQKTPRRKPDSLPQPISHLSTPQESPSLLGLVPLQTQSEHNFKMALKRINKVG